MGLPEHVADALAVDVVAARRVHGGDVAASFAVDLADGRRVFAKTHPTAPPGFFTTEAASLSWLREPGVVLVPEVLAVSDDPPLLVLEWIDEGRPVDMTEAELGRALAALHRAGAAAFGRSDRRSTGSRGLPNEPCDDWATFYATQRMAPLGRLAQTPARCPSVPSLASRRWTPTASVTSAAHPNQRLACTAICGPEIASSTRRGAAGSSIPRATAAIVSSISQ